MRHVIVVGAGASGIVAAISAAREGARVTLLEQKDRIGKKILSTGNGRCNFTNTQMSSQYFRSDSPEIVSTVLEQFGHKETIHFFEELGLICKDRQGYIYPITDQATTVLDVLRMECERLGIRILTEQKVDEIKKNGNKFIIHTAQNTLQGDAVILSTGGKAAPVLGSDGNGYHLAKKFGHHISPVVPALVQLRSAAPYFKQLAGIRTQANVKVYINDEFVAADNGELQLTNYGISGIPVFQISRYAAKALYEQKSVEVEIDFIPSMDETQFDTYMKNRLETQPNRSAEQFLIGIFHKNLIQVFLKEVNITSNKKIRELDRNAFMSLLHICKHFRVKIHATNGFEQAQICAGGVKTSEVNCYTLESLNVEHLFITGELLDVDGICGGYNLQWAWATGYIAGQYAAKGKSNASNRTT